MSKSQIEYIWEHFGGSIWEISALLGELLQSNKNGKIESKDLEKIVEGYLLQARSYFEEYVGLDNAKAELLREIDKYVQEKTLVKEHLLGALLEQGHYADREALQEELNNLVRNNYLYYNPTRAEYKLQGKSMEIWLKRYVEEVVS